MRTMNICGCNSPCGVFIKCSECRAKDDAVKLADEAFNRVLEAKREFNPHDKVWYMENNRPVQGRIYIKELRANTCVIDGEIKSVDTSYTVVENYGRTQDGQHRDINQLFESKEALLASL